MYHHPMQLVFKWNIKTCRIFLNAINADINLSDEWIVIERKCDNVCVVIVIEVIAVDLE